MIRGHSSCPPRGHTLLELLVAWTLGLMLITALVSLQAPLARWAALQHALARMDEDARHVLDLLSREVAMAGHLGCRALGERVPLQATPASAASSIALPADGRDPAVLLALGARGSQPLGQLLREPSADRAARAPRHDEGLTLDPRTALRGFDTPPRALFGPGARAPLDGSPVLFLARGGNVSVTLLTDQQTSDQPLPVDADDAPWLTGARRDAVFDLLIADCVQATLLRAAVEGRGDGAQLHHGVTQGNLAAALAQAATYPQEAQVMPLEWRLYYLARGPGAESPGLYEVLYDGHQRLPARELVDGIESLQFLYGLHDAPARVPHRPAWPQRWVERAVEVHDWSHVVALRVRLVMSSSPSPELRRHAAIAATPPLRRAFERTFVRRPGFKAW